MRASERGVPWDESSDDLVRRATSGDRDAFGSLYERLFDPVARYLYYRLGDKGEAESMTNEVFVSAYRSLSRFRGGYFPGWIFRIARNASIGAMRKRRMHLVELERADTLPSSDPSPHELAEAADSHEGLHRALSKLKGEQRDVVVMKFLLGMTNREVSESLGKSENAVNAQQNRALKSLKGLLEEEGL